MYDIVVEDGTGLTNSNSYVTVSGVDEYADTYGLDNWFDDTVTDEIKEQSLFRGMRYLEGLSWRGKKNTQEQSLEWPRCGVMDRNNYEIPDDVIPKEVIRAQCEITVLSLPDSDINLQPNVTKDDYNTAVGIDGATSEQWANIGLIRPKSTAVLDILKGLIKNSTVDVVRS